jgi:hypothetical protein
MKNLYLIFCVIFLAKCSTAQYSYVYEIRHDNKQPKNEAFGDLSQYKQNSPSELVRSEASSGPEPRTRDFSVKSPEVGPTLMNMLKNQMSESSTVVESTDSVWPSKEKRQTPQTSQSNNDAIFADYKRQPLPLKSIFNVNNGNDLPNYADKYRQSVPKGYPILESQPIREEPKIYEQRPLYTMSYPSASPVAQSPRPQQNEEKMRTVHQIQTPNYRIQLVSQPEPLEKLLPLLQQYKLNQQPFQSYSGPSSFQTLSAPAQQSSYPSPPQQLSYGPESGKALVLDVEPDARISQPLRQSGSYIPESRPSARSMPQSVYEIRDREPLRAEAIRRYPSELKSEPRPILDLPRQELPPQIQQLRGRPLALQQLQQSDPRTHALIQSRPSYLSRPNPELVPVTALYQMAAPDLAKSRPSYSGVEYAAEEEAKRDGRRPITTYSAEPTVYRIVERPEKIDLRQQLEKLRDQSAQTAFFDKIKSQSEEMADKNQIKYRQIQEQPLIATDPNYKSSPIPEEYKPYTQTRYYKTYV